MGDGKEMEVVANDAPSIPRPFSSLPASSGSKSIGKRRPRRVASASSRSESLVNASTSRGGFDGVERHGEEEVEVGYDVRFLGVEDGWDRGDDEDDDHDEARCCRAAKGERVVSWTWVQELEAEEAECGLGQGSPSASLSFGVILESAKGDGRLARGQSGRDDNFALRQLRCVNCV